MKKNRFDATKEKFVTMRLFGKEVLFHDCRIDRDTVPQDIYVYELRDDCSNGTPYEIAKFIAVDFYGTILSAEPIELTKDNGGRRYIRKRDYGWKDLKAVTLKEWRDRKV